MSRGASRQASRQGSRQGDYLQRNLQHIAEDPDMESQVTKILHYSAIPKTKGSSVSYAIAIVGVFSVAFVGTLVRLSIRTSLIAYGQYFWYYLYKTD